MINEREVILFLNIIRIGNQSILKLIENGDISKLINLSEKSKLDIDLKQSEIDLILENANFDLEYEYRKLDVYGIKFATILDDIYPSQLRNIFDPPSLLYYKGNGFDQLTNILAIVGTRKPTEYGIWAVKKLISEMKNFDVKIASGMAIGIDYFAHSTAIDNNLPTVGVLASSLEYQYPARNIDLYEKMSNHLLISEFPLGSPPIKRNFVLRNRIISGLAFGLLVIQASEKSGTLITARYALEQNRDIFAVPGNINDIHSAGCNYLLKSGAKIVQCAKDIFEDLPFIKELNRFSHIEDKLDDNTKKIYKILKKNMFSIDELVYFSSLEVNQVYMSVVKLEIFDLIEKIGEKYFIV